MSKEEMIPRIRFKQYKEYFKIIEFRDFTKLSQGLQIPINDRYLIPNENTEFYITNEFLNPNSKKSYYIESPSENVVANEEDLLMTRTGNTGLVVTNVKGAFHNNFFKIDYDRKKSDKSFLFYLLNTPKLQHEMINRAGTSTIPDLTHSDFYTIQIYIPSKIEQQKIGHLFEKLDQAISLQRQVLETTKEYKQSMLQKMFPKKDEKVPEIRFKEFEGIWSGRLLEEITDNYDRYRIPITEKDRISGSTPYYGSNGIQDFIEGYTHKGNFVLLAEDGANDIDNYPVRFVSGKIWVNNHAHVLKAKDNVDSYFLTYVLNTINMRKYLVGSSRMKLNATTMMMIKLLIPSFEEQQKIGSFFKTLDEKIEQEEKKLETYQSMKKALMQRMFV